MNKIFVIEKKFDNYFDSPFHRTFSLFNRENSPVDGFVAIVNSVVSDSYPEPAIHDDNEGFFVIRGKGKIRIGGSEYSISENHAMLVPAGTPHAIRKDGSSELDIFIFHFPCEKQDNKTKPENTR